MIREVAYYCGQVGSDTALQVLGNLHPKTLARSLAFIDLLEQLDLPREFDREIGSKDLMLGKRPDTEKLDDIEDPTASLRSLKAHSGKTKLKVVYARFDGKAIILGAGPQTQEAELSKLVHDFERYLTAKGKRKSIKDSKLQPALKNHREFVAELTLNQPVLAAHYSKARERAQFALSLVRLRDKAQFTNETLAQRTGLTVGEIKKLTRGRLPKLETMRRLADALNAHIVIAPEGGIVLEAHDLIEFTSKSAASNPEYSRPSLSDPMTVADLLLVQ